MTIAYPEFVKVYKLIRTLMPDMFELTETGVLLSFDLEDFEHDRTRGDYDLDNYYQLFAHVQHKVTEKYWFMHFKRRSIDRYNHDDFPKWDIYGYELNTTGYQFLSTKMQDGSLTDTVTVKDSP